MPKFPIKREELKDGDCLCNHCTALCCRYFSLPVAEPKTWADFDNFCWYLRLGRISIFVEDTTWYLVVHGDCQYLTPENLCGIYTTRPLICGQYTTDGCEYDNDFVFDKYFETPAQILEYAEAILPPRKTGPPHRPETLMVPIDSPTNWDDYDNFRWYMTHGPVALLVKNEQWYLVVFRGAAPVLTPETAADDSYQNRLSMSGRSVIDRQPAAETFECDKYFETPEQIWDYAESILPPREPLERDKPQAVNLPVLNAV